jgi:hypothetical protein
MVFYERLLEEICDYYVTNDENNGIPRVELHVKYVGDENLVWVGYEFFYILHPEAVISFFRRSDMIDMFSDGMIVTDPNDDLPRDIVWPLSPLPEEEAINNLKPNSIPNNIAGGEAINKLEPNSTPNSIAGGDYNDTRPILQTLWLHPSLTHYCLHQIIGDKYSPCKHKNTMDSIICQGTEGTYKQGNSQPRNLQQGRSYHTCHSEV